MGKITKHIVDYVKSQTLMTVSMVIAVVVVVAIVAGGAWYLNKDNTVSVAVDRRIDLTPAQIQSIKDIGQWEFLSISDEEMVDTLDRGFFRDKELVRIYYGTLRLGIDLGKLNAKWIEVKDSSVAVTLPPIELLDRNFIDEARTRSFYESGSWEPRVREVLYKKAYKKMLDRCMTAENIAIAEANAKEQFGRFMQSMGFATVTVSIEKK